MRPTLESPTPSPSRRLLPLLLLGGIALLCNPISAQEGSKPASARASADAQATAQARANGPQTARSSHSVTHRVVVQNGKTIVDERTTNGRPVRGRNGRPRAGTPGSTSPLDTPRATAEETLERMRRAMERGAVHLPPVAPRTPSGKTQRAADSARAADTARAHDSSRATRSTRNAARPRLDGASKPIATRGDKITPRAATQLTPAPRTRRPMPGHRAGKITPPRPGTDRHR